MKNIAIVVVAYNRVKSLKRLLISLKSASYNGVNVPLIISIDKSESMEVAEFANAFEWPYGEKEVIQHPENLGLRKHVLFCGNLTKNYDAVIVLEDDIYVSKYFYKYVYQTVEKYDSCDLIAGISLYTHLWNVGANRPFTPLNNGFDAYFLQYAQSWGQVWTKRMWSQFYEWYIKSENDWSEKVNLPNNIQKWPDSSWLKYYISYTTKTNRYFVYPYISLTTNFTDAGTHNKVSNTSFQVPLLSYEIEQYKLPDFTANSLKYDVFFEQESIAVDLEIPKEDICIDLYGYKNNEKKQRYWLTTKQLDYKIIKEYTLQLKPHELNVINNLVGNGIYLYDTSYSGQKQNSKKKNLQNVSLIRYDVRALDTRSLISLLKYELKVAIQKRLRNK
ncbi:glycosyltransferase [Peribacillus sp. NPDC076916]|uniref:glycosyltransferase n=1 Tax=Peribacillus sp. NPDC076916 TaxID=3390608 RepID=UPI003D065D94